MEGGAKSGTLALRPRDVTVEAGEGATVRVALFTGDLVRVYLG